MLKSCLLTLAATLLITPHALAQGTAPTKAPSPTTPQQEQRIRAGVELHDKKQYDEAIAIYQEVLKESADNMDALYELAYSYLEKKDFPRSLEAARRGIQYKSDMLPMFYDMIATNFEEQGQLPQAIQTYRQALSVDPGAGLIYYNLAITQRDKLKDPAAARQTLKQGAVSAPQFASVPVLLGEWFERDGYRTQAFLSLSRALVLEPVTQTYALWRRVLKGPENPMAADVMQDPDMRRAAAQSMKPQLSKTDEGDFAAVDASFASSFATFLEAMDDGTPEIEALIAQVNLLLEKAVTQAANPKNPSFVGRQYVPFFAELRQKGFVEPFVYWACQRGPVPGVRDWLKTNEGRVREFREWAAAYTWPTAPPPPATRR